MPKTYSETERENIRRSLRREASYCLAHYGVKRTTVDQLVKGASIPKGTFYLFYENKESLFFDLLTVFFRETEEMYLEMLQELDENHIVTSLTEVYFRILWKMYSDGVYRILDFSEMELIMRPLPDSRRKELEEARDHMFTDLFSYFAIDDEEDIKQFADGFEALMLILLQLDRVKEKEKTLRFLVRGLVLQMVE
ncbi:MAG: TetR/AcrR family transcriptional regulator [Candidatus Ornithospirochaeta sp.]|nr:TetR/AcrR family transcriptional regulator [Candidatus Ornithospirochaeta sp.]